MFDAKSERGRITTLLVLEIFLIFFQAFMVATLLPRLSAVFATSIGRVSGTGAIAFGALYNAIGITTTLIVFAIFQAALALGSLFLFDESYR